MRHNSFFYPQKSPKKRWRKPRFLRSLQFGLGEIRSIIDYRPHPKDGAR